MIEKTVVRSPCYVCERHKEHIANEDKPKTINHKQPRNGKDETECMECEKRVEYLRYIEDVNPTNTETFIYYSVRTNFQADPKTNEWKIIDRGWEASKLTR